MVLPPFSAKKVVRLLMLKVQKRVRGGILLANCYNFGCTFFFPTHRTNAALEGRKGQKKFQSPNVLVPFGGPLMAVSCTCILAWSLKKPNTYEYNFEGATRIRR